MKKGLTIKNNSAPARTYTRSHTQIHTYIYPEKKLIISKIL